MGLAACSPKNIFKIRCSEITSEVILVLKFIFGLDAAFGAPLASLVVPDSLKVGGGGGGGGGALMGKSLLRGSTCLGVQSSSWQSDQP